VVHARGFMPALSVAKACRNAVRAWQCKSDAMYVRLQGHRTYRPVPRLTRMAHQRPTELDGTEPARQGNDPGLSDDVRSDSGAPAAGPDSRPGVLIAVGFLVVFVIVLVLAIGSGLTG
jgi:hypothetical protein